MCNIDDWKICYFCGKGEFVTHAETIAFHQWTDRGYVFCRASVPAGICDHCGSRDWNDETEALIEEAVRREYDKMPSPASFALKNGRDRPLLTRSNVDDDVRDAYRGIVSASEDR